MPESVTSYPQWKAPAEDGQLLIWPSPDIILEQTRQNLQRLNSSQSVRIQIVPLPELRQRMRQWIGHANNEQPLIASGHQSELYHPGVWAKDVLGNILAKKLNGQAYRFAIDTDRPKHLHLRWPGHSEPITDDPKLGSAEWAALLAPPTPEHLRALQARFDNSARHRSFQPAIGSFFDSLRRLSLEPLNLSSVLTSAMHELDWSLGLRHHALVTGPIWESEPYLVFVHHLLARAAQFARDYNQSLADYRKAHRIRAKVRPMPDLLVRGGDCEVPFWLDCLASGHRRRTSVTADQSSWRLDVKNGVSFHFNPQTDGWRAAGDLSQWLRQNQLRLSPRALTFTMFVRLLLADEFIHGIGGGRYDQVTDLLIARHFAMEPPSFAVTTATLYFPEAIQHPRVCLPCIVHEGHHLRHSVLGEQKKQYLERIDSLPRKTSQRRLAFHEMHREIDTATDHPALKRWEERYRNAQHQFAEESALFDRELFYAIQPRERLERIIQQYAELL